MNIVFIVGSYYPYYSAVGKCVGNIADELSKEHRVTVICQKNLNEQEDSEDYNNQKIIRINTNENRIRNNINKKIQREKGIKRKSYQLLSNIYKTYRMVNTICSSVTIKKELVNEYLKALNEINEPIDLIIPASMPFESVISGLKHIEERDRRIKMIPYLFDQFVDSDTLHRNEQNRLVKRERHIKLERKVLLESYKIFAMHSLKEHFSNDLPEIKNIIYIEHPLLLEIQNSKKVNNEKINISYVGGLYKNYVTPDYLLELYKRSNTKNSSLSFYITGNCFDTVNKYIQMLPKNVFNYGTVDKERANEAMIQSDILINIAEKKGIQMSSKIFEYISNGKPIVHFYTVDDDINLEILKKYPLSLCLKQDIDKLDANVRLFNGFCESNAKSNIPFEEVEKIFYDATPKYTADLILDLME